MSRERLGSSGSRRRIARAGGNDGDEGGGGWGSSLGLTKVTSGLGSALKKGGQMVGVVAPDKGRRRAESAAGAHGPDEETGEAQEMGEYGGGGSRSDHDQSLRTFRGHTSSVYGCVFAPGQARFLSGGRDKQLRIWHLPEFGEEKVKVVTDHPGFVLSCDFAATKKHICSGSEDGNVYIYETSAMKLSATLKGHTSKVYAVHYTPCSSFCPGAQIVSGSLDKTVRIWNAETEQEEVVLTGHKDNVFATYWNHSGDVAASAGDDLSILLWDPRQPKATAEMKGHGRTIWNLNWSLDDQQLVSCGMGAETRVWDMRRHQEATAAFSCHHGSPTHQAIFARDTALIITCGRDKLVQVRRNAPGLPVLYELKGHTGTVYHMDLHPDGEQLLTSSVDTTLKMWRLKPAAEQQGADAAAGAAAAAAAGAEGGGGGAG